MYDDLGQLARRVAEAEAEPEDEIELAKRAAQAAFAAQQATRTIVARRRDAMDDKGAIKDSVVSITSLAHANDESRAVAAAAEAACGVNLFINDDEEINFAEEDEFVLIEIALDSGAGDHVAAEVDAPGYSVEESPGSKRGQKFMAAGGHKMPNKGQVTLHLVAPNQHGDESVDTVFQVADVTRPLWSVSKVCDAGYRVFFDDKTAKVVDQKNVTVCTFERQGGLYVGRVKLRNPKWSGFTRPGAK